MASEADTEESAVRQQAIAEEQLNKTGTHISLEEGSQSDQVTSVKAEDHKTQKSNAAASKGNDANTNGECFLNPPIVEKVVSTDECRHSVEIPEAGSSVTEEILSSSTGQQMNEVPEISEHANEHTSDTTNPNAEEKVLSNNFENEKQIAPVGEIDKEKEGSDYQVMDTSHNGDLEFSVCDHVQNLECSETDADTQRTHPSGLHENCEVVSTAEVGGSNEMEQLGDKENLEVTVEESSDQGLTEIIASEVVMPSTGGDKEPILETTMADKEVSINIPQSISSDVAEDVSDQEASDSSVQDGHQNNENETEGKEENFQCNAAQEDIMKEVEAKAFPPTPYVGETVQDVFPENSLKNQSAGDAEEVQEAMSYDVSQKHKDQGTAELASTGEDQSRCETDSYPELEQGEANSGNNMIDLEDIEKKRLEETLVKDSGESDAEDTTADLSAPKSEAKSVEVGSDGAGTESDALVSAIQDFDKQEISEQNAIEDDLDNITGILDSDVSSNLNESVDFIGDTQGENQDLRSELELKKHSEENDVQSEESIGESCTSKNTDCPAKNEELPATTSSYSSTTDTRNEELSCWKDNNSNVKNNEGSPEGDNHTYDGSPAQDFSIESHSTTEANKIDPTTEQTSADHDTDETIAVLQKEANPNLVSATTEKMYRDEHEEEANQNSTEASESSNLNVKEEADDHTFLRKEVEGINDTLEILKAVEKISEGSADIDPSPEQTSTVHDLVEEKATLHNQVATDAVPTEVGEMNDDEHKGVKKNSTETTENTNLNITEGANNLTCKRDSEEINDDASEIRKINEKSAVLSLDTHLSSEHILTVQDPDEKIDNLQNKVGPGAMPTKTADMNYKESEEEANQNSINTSEDSTLNFTEEEDDLTCQQRETEMINDTAEILMVDEKSAQRSVEIDLSTEHTPGVHDQSEKIADLQNDVSIDEPTTFVEVNVDEHAEELKHNFINTPENSTLNITGADDHTRQETATEEYIESSVINNVNEKSAGRSVETDHSPEHTLSVHDPDETIATQQNEGGTDGEPTRIEEVNLVEDRDDANLNADETSENSTLDIIEDANDLCYRQKEGKEENSEISAAEDSANTSVKNHHIAQNAAEENVANEEKLMVSHQTSEEDSEQVDREIYQLSDIESTQGHATHAGIDCCDQLREHPVEETAEESIQPDIPDTDILENKVFGTLDTNKEDKQITVEENKVVDEQYEKTDSDIGNQNEVVSVDGEEIRTNADAENRVPTQDDFSSNSNGNIHHFETMEETVSEVEKNNQESEDPNSFDVSAAEEEHPKDINADPSQNIDDSATAESDIIEVDKAEIVCHISEESDHDNGIKHAPELSQEQGENTVDVHDGVKDIEVPEEAAVAKIEHDHAEDDGTKNVIESKSTEKELECPEIATSENIVTFDEGNNDANEGNSIVVENQDSTASAEHQEEYEGIQSSNVAKVQPRLDHEESANREEDGNEESKEAEPNEEAPIFGKEATDLALEEVVDDEPITKQQNEASVAQSNNSEVEENRTESEQNELCASDEVIVAEDEEILNQRHEGSNSDGGKKSETVQATASEDEVSTISDHGNLDIVAVDKEDSEDQHEKSEEEDPSAIVVLQEDADPVGPASDCSESKVASPNGRTEESDFQQDKSLDTKNSEITTEAVADVQDITCEDNDLDADFAAKASESCEAEEKAPPSSEDIKKAEVDISIADDIEKQREVSDGIKEGSSSLVNLCKEDKEALHVSATDKTEQVDGEGFPPKTEDHLKQPDEHIELEDTCEQQHESSNEDSVPINASPYVEEAELEAAQQDAKCTISAQISNEEKPDGGNLQVAAEETYLEQVAQRECQLSISNFEPNVDSKSQELVETVRVTDGSSAAAPQQLSPNVGTSINSSETECETKCRTGRFINEDEVKSSNESKQTTVSLIHEGTTSTNFIQSEIAEQILLHCQEPTVNEEITGGKYDNEPVEEGHIRTEAQGHDAILTEDTLADSSREESVTSITGNDLNDESPLPSGKEGLIKQKSEENNFGSTEDNHQSPLLVQASRPFNEAGKGIQNEEQSEDVSNDGIETIGANGTIINGSPDNVLSEEVKHVDEQSADIKMETSDEEVNTSNDANKPEELAAKEGEKANEVVTQELVDAPVENTKEEEKQALACHDKGLNTAYVAPVLEETSSPSCHQEETIHRAMDISAHEQTEQAETDQANQYRPETKELENQVAEQTKDATEPHINQESDYTDLGEMSPRWSTEKLIVEGAETSPEHYDDIKEMTAAEIIANQISLAIERDEQLEKQSHEKLKEQDEAETVLTDMHENTPEAVSTDINDKPVEKEENVKETTMETYFPEVVWSSKSPGDHSPEENDTEKVLQSCTAGQAQDSLNENEIKEPNKSGEACNVSQIVDSISSLNYEEKIRIDKDYNQVAIFDCIDKLTSPEDNDQENQQEIISREIIAEENCDSTLDPDQATITDAAKEEAAKHKDDTVTERELEEMEMIAPSQHEDITASDKSPAEQKKQTPAAADNKDQSEEVQNTLQTPETLDMTEKSMTRYEEERCTKSKISLDDGQVEAIVDEIEDYILLEIPKTHASCLTPEIARDRKACTLAEDCDSPSQEENIEQASIIKDIAHPEKHANGTHVENQKENAKEQLEERALLNKYEENKEHIHQEPVICDKSPPADLKGAYEEKIGSFPATGTESNGNHIVSLPEQDPVKESLQGEKADDSKATSTTKESTAVTFSVKKETSPAQHGQIVERTREVEEINNVEPKTLEKEEIVTAEEPKTGMVKDDIEELDLMPITEEAMQEMDLKTTQKKSHNILTGVGSKMKHSISKVKKAIACTSSQFTQEEVIIKVNKTRKT